MIPSVKTKSERRKAVVAAVLGIALLFTVSSLFAVTTGAYYAKPIDPTGASQTQVSSHFIAIGANRVACIGCDGPQPKISLSTARP